MGLPSRSISTQWLSGTLREVELDAFYDILRNPRRRMVLRYLAHTPGEQAQIGALAEQLAAWENDIPLAAVTSSQRKRTYNTLQQHHLPKLDEAGLIAFERARGAVRLTTEPRQLSLLVGLLPRATSMQVTRFLMVGTLFWFALLGNWLAVHVFEVVPEGTGTLLFGASFAALFGIHGYLLYRFLNPRKNIG